MLQFYTFYVISLFRNVSKIISKALKTPIDSLKIYQITFQYFIFSPIFQAMSLRSEQAQGSKGLFPDVQSL